MRKSENDFVNKFKILNSQENSQEIIWSSSDSSDYENIFYNQRIENKNHKVNSRKRKRISRTKKSLKNISNLEITYDENINNIQETNNTSPIIDRKVTKCLSPILFPSQHQRVTKSHDENIHQKSPILSFPQSFNHGRIMKSPILLSKCKSPKYSPKIRKKLFKTHSDIDLNFDNFAKINDNCMLDATESTRINQQLTHSHTKEQKHKENMTSIQAAKCKNDKSNNDLVNIVKSYFNNQFSLETNSQNSISEYDSTPKNNSKTSEEIDIISLSDENENSNIESINKDTDKEDSKNTKGLKYKKDGMAYRLHAVLKKQNASISLWQHEKFLTDNSKFVIPKGDYTTFRIINVQLKYGCYLIEVTDVNDDHYFIIINNIYVSNALIEANMLLKLYKPYRLVSVNNCKLILNAFKFECDKMNRI